MIQTSPSKYHALPLFDLTGELEARCLGRLREQSRIYQEASDLTRSRMRVRALFVCALTLNATAVWTSKLLARGTFAMVTQRRFFHKRRRLPADQWGMTAKSCFARALAGVSLGKDGVCIDRHLARIGSDPEDAAAQWAEWFRLYESMYGAGETCLCIRWHVELLDWIALQGPKPESWK